MTIDRVVQLRPDEQIGMKSTSLRGKDIYNETGSRQTQVAVSKKLKTAKLYGRVENDGDAPDELTMKGTKWSRQLVFKVFKG